MPPAAKPTKGATPTSRGRSNAPAPATGGTDQPTGTVKAPKSTAKAKPNAGAVKPKSKAKAKTQAPEVDNTATSSTSAPKRPAEKKLRTSEANPFDLPPPRGQLDLFTTCKLPKPSAAGSGGAAASSAVGQIAAEYKLELQAKGVQWRAEEAAQIQHIKDTLARSILARTQSTLNRGTSSNTLGQQPDDDGTASPPTLPSTPPTTDAKSDDAKPCGGGGAGSYVKMLSVACCL